MELTRKDGIVVGTAVLAGVGLALLHRKLTAYRVPAVWAEKKGSGGKFASINRPTAGPQRNEALKRGKHPIQVYSLGTPNGVKVTAMLEELVDMIPGFEYDAWLINIMKGDQFTSGFVDINPNSKIPAMMDYSDESKPVRLFESGSILIHLADKYDKSGKLLPKDPAARAEVINWLMWQMGSAPFLGGGFGHFYNYAPVKIEYAIDRYSMEAKRQMDVLNRELADGRPYICGSEFTLADLAIWPWYGILAQGKLYGDAKTFLDVEASYPHVVNWAKRVAERPSIKRGRMVNRTWGELSEQLHERHDRTDFQTKTQDKLKE